MFRFLKAHVEQQKQKRTEFETMKVQMERQRYILDEQSVFLVDEFLRSAVKPLVQKDSQFKSIYGRKAEKIHQWFDGDDNVLDLGMIPFEYLGEKVQKELKQNVGLKAEDVIQERIQAEGTEQTTFNLEGEEFGRDEFIEKYIDTNTSRMVFPGVKLWELGELLEDSGFMAYEDRAIKSGRGELVLDFWLAMNELEDYQSLFPESGGGSNDKDEKDRLKELVGKLTPALG